MELEAQRRQPGAARPQRGDVLLRAEEGGGHFGLGFGSRDAGEAAEVYAFLLAALGPGKGG